MKIEIKRKELPFMIAVLGQVKGMKDFKKAISLGRDSRELKAHNDDTEVAIRNCKPEKYDLLLEELQELKSKKAKECELKPGEMLNENTIKAHVLMTWPKAKEWNMVLKEYNDAAEKISNEKVEIDLHTELTEKDLPKCAEDVAIAEVLSYFMKK